MTTYFVSRHPGAHEWAEQKGIVIDRQIDHLDVDAIKPDDVVIGSLPVNLAARVCERGGRYLHLSLELPAALRGKELSTFELSELGAEIEEYLIKRITKTD